MPLSFFAVEKNNPHVQRIFSRTEVASQLEHYARSRAAVVRANEIRDSHGVIVRGVQDDGRILARNLGDDVFHRDLTERTRAMEVVLFDLTSIALELFDDVRLCLMNCL